MKTVSKKNLSPFGIGSYGIGGRGHRDMQITEKVEDQKYINALVYALRKGMNFTEVSLGYGHGQAMVLFRKALEKSNIQREDIFFTHSLYTRDLPKIKMITEDIVSFHKIMQTTYADSTLVTQSLIQKFGRDEIYPMLHKLLQNHKTRYVSLSNANPQFIKEFKKEFKDKFIAHEGHLSFEIRALQDKKIFEVCNKLKVKNIIWRPLRRNKTLHHNWPLLLELSKKYRKTQTQIILNWMKELGYYPMIFSLNNKHIDENITSTDFTMTRDEYKRITMFRPKNYFPPKVNWNKPSIDDDIVRLANEFEEHIKV